jgi:hypothetical protein
MLMLGSGAAHAANPLQGTPLDTNSLDTVLTNPATGIAEGLFSNSLGSPMHAVTNAAGQQSTGGQESAQSTEGLPLLGDLGSGLGDGLALPGLNGPQMSQHNGPLVNKSSNPTQGAAKDAHTKVRNGAVHVLPPNRGTEGMPTFNGAPLLDYQLPVLGQTGLPLGEAMNTYQPRHAAGESTTGATTEALPQVGGLPLVGNLLGGGTGLL